MFTYDYNLLTFIQGYFIRCYASGEIEEFLVLNDNNDIGIHKYDLTEHVRKLIPSSTDLTVCFQNVAAV